MTAVDVKTWYSYGSDPSMRSDIRCFDSTQGTRDMYGNRIFTSSGSEYIDRLGNVNRAFLLVSPDGQELLGRHRWVLNDIGNGLTAISDQLTEGRSLSVREGRDIQILFAGGAQSSVYLFELNREKYVVKKRKKKEVGESDITQPYVNEMRQTQEIQSALRDELIRLGVSLQTFLFATPEVACVRYEEGVALAEDYFQLEDVASRLNALLKQYVEEQKNKGRQL
jgi:hypothetical protein